MMSVITKVIIDTKEYKHLKEIAAAYKILVQKKELSGSGACHCMREAASKKLPSLSQIAAENDRSHAISPPQKEIIGSITDPYGGTSQTQAAPTVEDDETFNLSPDDRLEFEEAITKKDRWYYVGAWRDVRK